MPGATGTVSFGLPFVESGAVHASWDASWFGVGGDGIITPMTRSSFVRQPLPRVTARYDRMARYYRFAAPLIALPPGMRRKAVDRLGVSDGDTVLEVGCGTGRNLPLLVRCVGAHGHVIGIDASGGMLTQARRLVTRRGWPNVSLLQGDAAEVDVDCRPDAVLFSLSYSVLPARQPVLKRAWEALRPGGRLLVMDAGLPANALGRLLGPFAELVATVFPGDPYSRPWEDLAQLCAPVRTERFQLGTYFICSADKNP
jgi:ubiquinone/menaquinone biosynthesis C-methylase UbiE